MIVRHRATEPSFEYGILFWLIFIIIGDLLRFDDWPLASLSSDRSSFFLISLLVFDVLGVIYQYLDFASKNHVKLVSIISLIEDELSSLHDFIAKLLAHVW